ncbi:hypothetical protein ACFPOI_26050 [Nonomuraea angiospora]|uniref:Uncharacterized protein n=1 Tax=Nonomuraea angiospora TaxID=46172 RepID=A0ABR9LPM7_9ACTN|nr:hypothetical protein [Nonomuraea angiospora]MBE1582375.1 hypothetical protein [Nonomuraea angiospora]
MEAVLVIVDQGGAVLCDMAGGDPALPRMRFDGRWPPMDSELTDRVRHELGLTTVVLEPLDFTTVVLLAADRARPVSADGFAWHGHDAVTGQSPVLDRRAARSRPPASDWFRPGWFERAESYIDGEIKAAGRVRLGPSRQIKHWSMSAVLRTPTDRGDLYLKAVLPRLAREPDITRYLASLRIAPFATITAMSPRDRWWLAEDFGAVDGWAVSKEQRRACLTQLVMVQETIHRGDELIAAVVELMKLIELADIVGPDHDFNWLPMTYGWGRRLLHAADDPNLTVNGWREQGSSAAL